MIELTKWECQSATRVFVLFLSEVDVNSPLLGTYVISTEIKLVRGLMKLDARNKFISSINIILCV